MSDLVTTIFAVITQAVTSFVSSLGAALNGMTSLFYTAPSGSGSGQMTFLGTLLLIAAGIGIVYWAFRLIRALVRRA